MRIFLSLLLTSLFEISFPFSTTSFTTDIKFKNCKNVIKGNCQLCDDQTFLFSLPQDNDELEIKAGTLICVECPYKRFNEENNMYCGDCLDNSQTWDKNRLCTYDYKTKSSDKSVFHRIERPAIQLFYVVESGTSDFTTIACDGCAHFCRSQNQTCFPVSKQFSYDWNNLYITCADGYAYSDSLGGCDSCPENCLSCIINIIRNTDATGKVTVTSKKNCLICNKGFSLLTTRTAVNSAEFYSQCIACFTGCDLCHFGKNNINLNEKPWDDYNNIPQLLTYAYQSNEVQFYNDLFTYKLIYQRCEQCTSTTQSTFIPSLNRKTCIRCGTNCRKCEYVSYALSDHPTRDINKVVEPDNSGASTSEIEQIESSYVMRCRECDKFAQTFYAIGTGCGDCTIANCLFCHKAGDPTLGSDSSFSTISKDFEPLNKEEFSVEKCLQCNDGFYLSELGTCLIFDLINQPDVGCLTYEKILTTKQCRKCGTGYTLYKDESVNVWKCSLDCQQQLQDYLCQSCVQYTGSNSLKAYRCQKCLDGFYVDMETGKCKQCTANGYCKECYTYSLVNIHYTHYYNFNYDNEKTIFGPYCYTCTAGSATNGPFKNEDTRICEKGGPNCASFLPRGLRGYCDQCESTKVGISLSSSFDDSDCIACPLFTIGCRDRTQTEIAQFNQFFNPTLSEYNLYQRITYKCDTSSSSIYLDTKIGRCISTSDCSGVPCDRYDEITIDADCSEKENDVDGTLKINNQYNDITSKTSRIIIEDALDSKTKNSYFQEWNDKAVTKIIINLNFKYKSTSKNQCFFQKETYFTSNIRRNIFSVKELELIIKVDGAPTTVINSINWYLKNTIYFEYFTTVSLKGIKILPATDLKNSFNNIPKFDAPFGFEFINNDGSKLILEDITISNSEAEQLYQNKNLYTKPYSEQSNLKKKYKPFYMILRNTYDLQLKNVVIQSQNYLLGSDLTFQAKPFGFIYDENVNFQYFSIKLDNVQFIDVSVESQALFELQSINLITAPEWNSKIQFTKVLFKDTYFVNEGGLVSTQIINKPMGMIFIDGLTLYNVEYNNSRGIVDFTTMQAIKIRNLLIQDSLVNSTNLFYITTIEMSSTIIKNTKFTTNGRLVKTQYELKTIRLNDPDYSGLKIYFTNLYFDSVICLTPQCLILITQIDNIYNLPLNITMKNIRIFGIQSQGFDITTWEAATSAAIKVEKCYTLLVSQFESLQNPDLALFYVDQVWDTKFINLLCHQNINLNIRNNYCLFINNPYKSVNLLQIQLYNLIGIDNSFIGISSWNNLIYNTTTNDYNEQINIDGVYVSQCTIKSTVLASPSSSILIDSTQEQIINIKNMQFYSNQHIMEIEGTLRPSNPTFLIRSIVGTLYLNNSIWKLNNVQGYGSILYLEVGILYLTNITMTNSNFDSTTRTKLPIINEITEGGHIQISSYNLNINNCTFTNSTGKIGGAIFIRTLKDGKAFINNTIIRYAYTPLNGAVVSRGGCIYVDSTASQLNMIISESDFRDCYSRGEGGGIYLEVYDKQATFLIKNSIISNCYSLSGVSLKVTFNDRTNKIQKTILQSVKIAGNLTNFLEYIQVLDNLSFIEKYLFIQRFAAIEQNNGQIEIQNGFSEGLFYYSYISLFRPSLVQFNMIECQHSIISYRPHIEILEPLLNPLKIDSISFRNITSINSINIDCTDIYKNIICLLLSIRIEFPETIINPAMMLFDQILKTTPLYLKNIFINRVICYECIGGLVQIMRVSNTLLLPLIELSVCRCSNSQTNYYGCFAISSEQYYRQQIEIDNYLNLNFNTSLSYEKIIENTGMISKYRILQQQQIIENKINYSIPSPSHLSHIIIDSSNCQEIKSIHGGCISIYGLIANITNAYCTQISVKGRGGCIYFEAYKKNKNIIYQYLNIARCTFFRNNASIGGAIATIESGLNNYSLTENIMLQNYALLYGDHVSTYPEKLGIIVDQQFQSQSQFDNRTGWLHYPLVLKSGQQMSQFQNQSVIIIYLDGNNKQMGYQYQQQCNLKTLDQKVIDGNEPSRNFDLIYQGFNYSNLTIKFDPYNNVTLDINLSSTHINIPIYYEQYPYQLLGYDIGYQLQARIRSVECELGESYNQELGTCTPCPIKQYVLQYKGICLQMNENTMNFTQRNYISIKNYHWRPNHLNDLPQECSNKKENCKGGFDVGNDLCYEGMIGALCEECDIYGVYWDQKYSNSAKYECGNCQEKTRNLIMIICLTVFTLYQTLQSIRSNQERMENQTLIKILITLQWLSEQCPDANAAVLMKIFNNHTQLLSILEGFKISIPPGTVDAINTISMPAKTVGNSLDCFLVDNTYGIDLLYSRLLWSIGIQLMYIISMIVIISIGYVLKKGNFKCSSYWTMFIFMFVFLQPNYIIEFMNLISSRQISGDLYVQANVSYRYDTDKHNQWIWALGVPGLIIMVIVLPLYFFYNVFRGAEDEKLNNFSFMQSWGFFYNEYKQERYFWEFIRIFYRSLISIIICIAADNVVVKGSVSIVILFAYMGLSQLLEPYRQRNINKFDVSSIAVLLLSYVIGLYLHTTVQEELYQLTIVGYIFLAVLNIVYIVWILYYILIEQIRKLRPLLDKLKDKFRDKIVTGVQNRTLFYRLCKCCFCGCCSEYEGDQYNIILDREVNYLLRNQTAAQRDAQSRWKDLAATVQESISEWKKDKFKKFILVQWHERIQPPQDEGMQEYILQM